MKISVLNANSVHLDQMPCPAESDLGYTVLSMSLVWDARHKCVNLRTYSISRHGQNIIYKPPNERHCHRV